MILHVMIPVLSLMKCQAPTREPAQGTTALAEMPQAGLGLHKVSGDCMGHSREYREAPVFVSIKSILEYLES